MCHLGALGDLGNVRTQAASKLCSYQQMLVEKILLKPSMLHGQDCQNKASVARSHAERITFP